MFRDNTVCRSWSASGHFSFILCNYLKLIGKFSTKDSDTIVLSWYSFISVIVILVQVALKKYSAYLDTLSEHFLI